MTFFVEKHRNIIVCEHPIVKHNLAIARDKNTNSELFRLSVKKIAHILINKAFENIPLVEKIVDTPLTPCVQKVIRPNVDFVIAPILRAGLIFSELALDFLPQAKTHHIGLYRDEKTLKPVPYYNNLPDKFVYPDETYVYILDPMLATGGSGIASVDLFTDLGVPEKNISFISLISSPEGATKLSTAFPDLNIITGCMDEKLNEFGYILPGLGDAGDRTFNT